MKERKLMQILNVEPIIYNLLFVYIGIAIVGFFLDYIIWSIDEEWDSISIALFIIFFVFGTVGTTLAIFDHNIEIGKNRYEVIFDKDYSIQKVYENYKVIEQRGDIWVLEDKEETK